VASAARASGPGWARAADRPVSPSCLPSPIASSPPWSVGALTLTLDGAYTILSACALLIDVLGQNPAASKTFF
jgi:hypothetical protein